MTNLPSLRPVRSFVRRQGRMNAKHKEAYAKLWAKYGCDNTANSIKSLFAAPAPVVLEIGFGMGDSLLQMALSKQDHNFIGIEVHTPGVAKLIANADIKGVNNLKIFQEDAIDILEKCISDASLDKVYILFPDPWHKKRHNKRRLLNKSFFDLLVPKLKPQGKIQIATDWQDYAEAILPTLEAHPSLINCFKKETFAPPRWQRPQTKYESRGIKLGHHVYEMVFAVNS